MVAVLATNDVWALFQLPAIQRSALALLIASIGLPVVGVLMIGLDVIPVRFAMMHTALLGVAIGLMLDIDPIVCALVLSAACSKPCETRLITLAANRWRPVRAVSRST